MCFLLIKFIIGVLFIREGRLVMKRHEFYGCMALVFMVAAIVSGYKMVGGPKLLKETAASVHEELDELVEDDE